MKRTPVPGALRRRFRQEDVSPGDANRAVRIVEHAPSDEARSPAQSSAARIEQRLTVSLAVAALLLPGSGSRRTPARRGSSVTR
jgi:hypothetical protein